MFNFKHSFFQSKVFLKSKFSDFEFVETFFECLLKYFTLFFSGSENTETFWLVRVRKIQLKVWLSLRFDYLFSAFYCYTEMNNQNLILFFVKITSYTAMSFAKRPAHFGWHQVYNFSYSYSQIPKNMTKNVCSLKIRNNFLNFGSIQLLLDQRTRLAHLRTRCVCLKNRTELSLPLS